MSYSVSALLWTIYLFRWRTGLAPWNHGAGIRTEARGRPGETCWKRSAGCAKGRTCIGHDSLSLGELGCWPREFYVPVRLLSRLAYWKKIKGDSMMIAREQFLASDAQMSMSFLGDFQVTCLWSFHKYPGSEAECDCKECQYRIRAREPSTRGEWCNRQPHQISRQPVQQEAKSNCGSRCQNLWHLSWLWESGYSCSEGGRPSWQHCEGLLKLLVKVCQIWTSHETKQASTRTCKQEAKISSISLLFIRSQFKDVKRRDVTPEVLCRPKRFSDAISNKCRSSVFENQGRLPGSLTQGRVTFSLMVRPVRLLACWTAVLQAYLSRHTQCINNVDVRGWIENDEKTIFASVSAFLLASRLLGAPVGTYKPGGSHYASVFVGFEWVKIQFSQDTWDTKKSYIEICRVNYE